MVEGEAEGVVWRWPWYASLWFFSLRLLCIAAFYIQLERWSKSPVGHHEDGSGGGLPVRCKEGEATIDERLVLMKEAIYGWRRRDWKKNNVFYLGPLVVEQKSGRPPGGWRWQRVPGVVKGRGGDDWQAAGSHEGSHSWRRKHWKKNIFFYLGPLAVEQKLYRPPRGWRQ